MIAQPPPTDRFDPVPPTTLTVAHKHVELSQGGQRVRVTIPATPATNQFGDSFSYRWDTKVSGGARCQPGALPDLTDVTAGTVIDAPLPKPANGWCRGEYGVTLEAVIVLNCAIKPTYGCDPRRPLTETVANAGFKAGSPATVICHRHGEAKRCWTAGTYRQRAFWSVSATLDDLLGPDGATTEAEPYFDRAFRKHPLMNKHWEIDDNFFYGYPTSRREAIAMARLVDRVLRAGRYYGKT